MSGEEVRWALGQVGCYPTPLGVGMMGEEHEQESARETIRQQLELLAPGDLLAVMVAVQVLVRDGQEQEPAPIPLVRAEAEPCLSSP